LILDELFDLRTEPDEGGVTLVAIDADHAE
jgi:hypothetical protein